MAVSVELVAEGSETSLFHTLDSLQRLPEVNEHVYLDSVGYKVEKIETYLEDDPLVNSPTSGQVAPWGLTLELYKIHLSVLP